VNEDCLKLTTYFGERDRSANGLLADELMDLYGEHRLRASVLLRGSEGFGRLHHLHTDRLLTLSEDLPVVSIAVDRRARIEALLAPVLALQGKGLITLERARLLSGSAVQAGLCERAQETSKLTVHLGRQDRVGRLPAHEALTAMLFEAGVAGATVLLGVDGTRDGRRTRARFFARNATVPTMLVAVGASERIARALAEIPAPLDPAITLERVRVCKRDGELLDTPHELPGSDEHGLAL
jgi:PII-like signaling protein